MGHPQKPGGAHRVRGEYQQKQVCRLRRDHGRQRLDPGLDQPYRQGGQQSPYQRHSHCQAHGNSPKTAPQGRSHRANGPRIPPLSSPPRRPAPARSPAETQAAAPIPPASPGHTPDTAAAAKSISGSGSPHGWLPRTPSPAKSPKSCISKSTRASGPYRPSFFLIVPGSGTAMRPLRHLFFCGIFHI